MEWKDEEKEEDEEEVKEDNEEKKDEEEDGTFLTPETTRAQPRSNVNCFSLSPDRL